MCVNPIPTPEHFYLKPAHSYKHAKGSNPCGRGGKVGIFFMGASQPSHASVNCVVL